MFLVSTFSQTNQIIKKITQQILKRKTFFLTKKSAKNPSTRNLFVFFPQVCILTQESLWNINLHSLLWCSLTAPNILTVIFSSSFLAQETWSSAFPSSQNLKSSPFLISKRFILFNIFLIHSKGDKGGVEKSINPSS